MLNRSLKNDMVLEIVRKQQNTPSVRVAARSTSRARIPTFQHYALSSHALTYVALIISIIIITIIIMSSSSSSNSSSSSSSSRNVALTLPRT